jgi:hypothetical protein
MALIRLRLSPFDYTDTKNAESVQESEQLFSAKILVWMEAPTHAIRPKTGQISIWGGNYCALGFTKSCG